MSGQSDKKSRKNNQQSNKILLLAIAICLGKPSNNHTKISHQRHSNNNKTNHRTMHS